MGAGLRDNADAGCRRCPRVAQALIDSRQFSKLLWDMASAGLEPKTSEGALLLVAPNKHVDVRHALAGLELRFYNLVIAEARATRTMCTACTHLQSTATGPSHGD